MKKTIVDFTPFDKDYRDAGKEEMDIVMKIVDLEHVLTFLESMRDKAKKKKEHLEKCIREYEK